MARDSAAPARAAMQWVLPRAEVEGWFAAAQPGERLVYGHGSTFVRGETSAFVRELQVAGKATLNQTRVADGAFDYVVTRRAGPAHPADPRRATRASALIEEATEFILRTFKREANFRQRASSNRQLARGAKVPVPTVAWIIRRLRAQNVIHTHSINDGAEAGWRWVTIVESGRHTKLPPSIEAARASLKQEGGAP